MRHFRKRPLEVFQCVLERWIVLIMPLIIRRSLRTGLGGVYVRGCWEGFPYAAVIAFLVGRVPTLVDTAKDFSSCRRTDGSRSTR